ncbi:hypothetical protein GCM10010294_66890 [Streptomyces griseoloalbus]|uniref:hypothetical protein n=1 Tax=Streptomyces griseoloalbus TaxID=67303 RepID=UPI0018755B32|nr:hypothetical protein GCM10010294_66890 [Streptomyces griseoloalbus]
MTRLGGDRGEIHDAVGSLEPTDSTDLGAGVETGTDQDLREPAEAIRTADRLDRPRPIDSSLRAGKLTPE